MPATRARPSARNPAPARTVTFDVTYPDAGENAWPWTEKFSRERSWHGIEEWLKGVKRHVPRYGVSVLIIKERGRTVAIYNAALAPRVHWRGSDVRIYRDAGYTDPAWLHGPVQSYDYSTGADGTIASREGLIGEVPPLPVVVGREAARNGRGAATKRPAKRGESHVRNSMPEHVADAINGELTEYVGGKPLFRSIGAAIAKCADILARHGYEWGEVINSHTFLRDTGRTAIDIAQSNADDPFAPAQVEDVALSFQWHKFDTGRVEAIAYVSRGATR